MQLSSAFLLFSQVLLKRIIAQQIANNSVLAKMNFDGSVCWHWLK